MSVPGKIHNIQLVQIQPEERLAATSEPNLASSLVTDCGEIDTEMDHIMTNFKILYDNSLLFAKDVFFEGNIGMEQMNRQFINHYGDLEILDGGKRFRFCEAFLIKLFLNVY
jgi:hypothetical protein